MNEPSLEEVEKAILESAALPGILRKKEHLEHLRVEMNGLGYDFPDSDKGKKKSYRKAKDAWWKIRDERNTIDKISLNDLSDIPSKEVEVGEKKYHLHGLVHGAFWPNVPSRSATEFVSFKAKEYASTPGSNLIWECNLDVLFDSKGTGKVLKDHVNLHKSDYAFVLAAYTLFLPISILAKINPKSREEFGLLKKAMKDLRYLPRVSEAQDKNRLPEPLRIEYRSYSDLFKRLEIDRSRYMAKGIIREGRDAGDVHAIVGLGHVPQIEYFLRNPDADYERIING